MWLLGAVILVASSCSNKGEGYAEDLCDCMEESGTLDNAKEQMKDERPSRSERAKSGEKFKECAKPILDEMYEDMKDMDSDEKEEFVKDLIKGIIDTDCADQLMDEMEWDELEENIDETIERGDRKSGRGDVDVCDCVNMGKEMAERIGDADGDYDEIEKIEAEYEDIREECEEMAEDLSDDERRDLFKRAEECDDY